MHTPHVSIQQRVTIAADTILRGRVLIKSGTVVHPHAHIDASLGPIVIGENCIVEEHAHIVSSADGITIGDGNVFRVGCHVACSAIGNCNVLEPACDVASSVRITNFCTVGAGCHVCAEEGSTYTLPERTVVYGASSHRTWSGDGIGQQLALHAKQLAYLRDQIPKSHKLRVIR